MSTQSAERRAQSAEVLGLSSHAGPSAEGGAGAERGRVGAGAWGGDANASPIAQVRSTE